MLASVRIATMGSTGAEMRPLRPLDAVRAARSGQQDRIAPEAFARETARSPEGRAPAYGRPASSAAPAFFGPTAFLAQMIAQADRDWDAPRSLHEDGVRAYRRVSGEDLVVIGPAGAGAPGLVL